MSEQKEQHEGLEIKAEELEDALRPEATEESDEKENEHVEAEEPSDAEQKSETEPSAEEEAEVEGNEPNADEAEAKGALEEEAEVPQEDLDAQIANLDKNDAAVLLIKKAKHIVHDAENQMEACKVLLSDDLKDFEIAKEALGKGGMDECEEMLDVLGYSGMEDEEKSEGEVVVFEKKEEVPPVYIRDVSSGKFTGFLLALFFSLLALLGLVYVATEKMNMTLDLSKIPSAETFNAILSWFGSLVGTATPAVGGALLSGAVLFIMWIVYTIRVTLKARSNLQFAKEELAKAEEYAGLKGTCKDEMDSIDAHIKDAIETLKTYEVILHEQEGKLKRIHHLEKSDDESAQYHARSLKEMEDTYDLIKTIKAFLNTPMSEEGKLSDKSTLFLYRAKNRLDKMIESLY